MYTSVIDILLRVDIHTRTAVSIAKCTVGMSLFKYFSTDREDSAPSTKQPRVDREDRDSHCESTEVGENACEKLNDGRYTRCSSVSLLKDPI